MGKVKFRKRMLRDIGLQGGGSMNIGQGTAKRYQKNVVDKS